MKTNGWLLALLLAPMGISAAQAGASSGSIEALVVEALTLAEAGRHAEAAAAFEVLVQDGVENPWIWFNAGNSWLRAREVGRAIAAYRRAEIWLRGDANFRRNLARALAERPEVLQGSDERSPTQRIFFWQESMGLDGQQNLALGLGAVAFLLGLVRTVRGQWPALTKSVALGLAALALLVAIGAWLDHAHHRSGARGVLIRDRVVARTLPDQSAEPALQAPLRVGAEFEVLRQQPDWVEARLTAELTAWLPRTAVATR